MSTSGCQRQLVHVGNYQPITVDGADVNMDLDADVTPPRPLCQMLLVSCKAVEIITPTYTWEWVQLQWKLHKLLFRAAAWEAGGPWTMLDKVLPCAGPVVDRCIANLVRGGCSLTAATAIEADLGWAMVDAAVELAGGGKGGGDTTTGGRGGGIKGGQRIIGIVVLDVDGNSGGVDSGRNEGGRAKDGRWQHRRPTRLL
jgi:hypothetical protein